MLSLEESKVLAYLQSHVLSPAEEVGRACLPQGSADEVSGLLSNLEWLGYVVCYGPHAVQITPRGAAAL